MCSPWMPTLFYRAHEVDHDCSLHPHTVIKRSEFNAGKYAPYVSDEVRIDIAVEAIKE